MINPNVQDPAPDPLAQRLAALAAFLRLLGQPALPAEALRHTFGGHAPSPADVVRYARPPA